MDTLETKAEVAVVWVNHCQILIPENPVPMSRVRLSKNGAYHTASCRAAIKSITKRVSDVVQADNLTQLDCPVRVVATFVCKRPQRLQRKSSPDGRIYKTTRPDIDNYLKMILDCCTAGGVWVDDGLVVEIETTKFYASKQELPHSLIVIQKKIHKN